MKNPLPKGSERLNVLKIMIILCICWVVMITGFLFWEINNQKQSINDLAIVEARASFNKDLAYRRWSAGHGGTYVPVTKTTPPNPYLKHIEERDIFTPSGKALTLVNPAYMTRQVHELGQIQYGTKGHITSLNPLRPENRPDAWEADALRAFEKNVDEIHAISRIDGNEYLRLMRPLYTEKKCLKCHFDQGYKLGDLRGGISVSVPIEPYRIIARKNIQNLALVHLMIGSIGIIALIFGGLLLNRKEKDRSVALASERKSSQRFYAIFEQAAVGVALVETETGGYVRINQKFCDIVGYSEEEMKQYTFMKLTHQEDLQQGIEQMEDLKSGEIREFTLEKRYFHKNGTTVWVSLTVSPMWKPGETPDYHIAIVKDITERKQAEAKLIFELKLNEAIAHTSKGIVAQEYDIKKVSDITLKSALKLTDSHHGFASFIDKNTFENVGHTLTDMFGSQCRVEDLKIVFPIGEDGKYGGLWGHALNERKGFFTNTPNAHPSSKGTPEGHIPIKNYLAVPVVMEEDLLGMIALSNSEREYTDLDLFSIERLAELFALAIHRHQYETERIDMEQNLRQLQKNEAIGALAGGIAHDFNNILFPIVGFAELLTDDIPKDSPLRESVDEILIGANRAKDLVKQILTFSRQTEQEIKPLKPHLVIKEVVKLIKATIPATIEIRPEIDNKCRTLMADPTQIHQIAMNLITNAYHAMADSGGKLKVVLKNVDLDEFGEDLSLVAGPQVLLSVRDTGSGMTPGTLEKIFDPYFTTKPKDKGTGLGLSVVYGIVKNYGGEIQVKSSPGKGSEFNIYFPAYESDPALEQDSKTEPVQPGNENILLIDDEEPILRLEQTLLERLGYTVDTARNGEEALKTLTTRPNFFDLVITDMTMPKMTGDILTREIKKISPKLPVIICTGFSEKLTQEMAEVLGVSAILTKPIIKTELARAIRNVLD